MGIDTRDVRMKASGVPWSKIVSAVVILVLISTVLVGWTYEQVGRQRDSQLYQQVGHWVDVGGRRLNIYCSGEGSPTVIFEAGGVGNGYSWALVQPEVARFAQACWYDRAGAGWSDTPSVPPTSASVINDLHELLQRAGVKPPYVLVGASVGGEYVRVYTAKFPSEVAGMVLVDSSHPDQNEPNIMKSRFNLMSSFRRQVLCTALPAMSRFGVLRLMLRPRSGFATPSLDPENASAVDRVFRNRPVTSATEAEQTCAATNSGRLVPDGGTGNPEIDGAARASGGLGNRPLIVLTAGRAFVPPNPAGAHEAVEFHEVWVHGLQAQLATLSTRGRQVVVENSGHTINFEAPGDVVKAVEDVVEQVRSSSTAQNAK